ncbi:uncharacterized protein A4U43_C01F33240 [Asparagus officinalis]|uniref:RRM domain-containing protein n=1 Tax=Asparagus officinalis TaxID=4686 RepID=A0A5P1FV00_ASPOF|nr:uncharacterized protein A4U43_C01F33240 [Asparagus officinalis]
MDGADGAGDDRTFRINFGREGTARLRERVKERLKEIMGDYTDDTLVEYVLVLLRNGRSKEEARRELNRDAAPRPVIAASHRLLQFAVRDAVKTVQQASTRTEPDLKRIRSVVSTSMEEPFLDERPQRLRSVARVPGPLSTALKAAAEAAEDVTKDRGPGSVFDRLSRGAYLAEPAEHSSMEPMLEGEYENPNQNPESSHAEYYQRSDYDGRFMVDMTMSSRIAALPDGSASDNDGYNNVAVVRNRGLNTSHSAVSANRDKKSLTLQHNPAQNADEVVKNARLINEDPPSSGIAKASSKIVNISVDVNTWKPTHFQVPKDISEAGNRHAVDRGDVSAEKTNVQQLKENDTAMTENEIARADVQKEPQHKGTLTSTPGSYTTSRPSDDVDSRTVFVGNVHFAATKDSLSRHFNKFGEVLKVIIVSDAATGQPKGSAYVEFLRKESAESALSLNGTSFLSRSLKVVRKSSIHSETAPMMGWPRIARASPFTSRVSRAAFSRGVLPGAFRARLPVKPGARSLQWKREDSAADGTKNTQNNNPLTSVTNVSSPTGRNLTYIRPESKVDASSGPA